MQPAVEQISFHIDRGETFALVGESGSGKSVTALSVLRLLPMAGHILSGEICMDGVDLLRVSERSMGTYRGGRIGVIFQDPSTALNPVMTVGQQIREVLAIHVRDDSRSHPARVIRLLQQVGLPRVETMVDAYPHQLSGGQRQRVMIAMALAGEPDLLIADEPTTALDVTIQAQILELLQRIQQETGMALWLITHDLGIVHQMAHRVAVMHQGHILEQSTHAGFFAGPAHDYSQSLLKAMPRIQRCRERPLRETSGHDEPLLVLEDFSLHFPIRKGLLKRQVGAFRAVDQVSLAIGQGETLALVGESGCGKTTLGKALLGLLPGATGTVRWARQLGGHIPSFAQIVFQDPYAAMNPRMTVGEVIEEGMRALRPDWTLSSRRQRCDEMLVAVGLDAGDRIRYPHEFSGGQRQRICIARALAVEPRLVILDEPTSALDVSVQAHILALLRDLRERYGLSYLFITHDLGVVAEVADRVAVMFRGQIVETGEVAQVLLNPREAYTRQLLQALPPLRWGACKLTGDKDRI
jgi:ABC-type microcin C transport system duplicated ATPase subunit YejF